MLTAVSGTALYNLFERNQHESRSWSLLALRDEPR